MKTTFTKKIAKNNKRLVKKAVKIAKKNPTATVAIAATAGTGFLGLGTLNVVQYMRNRKLIKAAKAMDEMGEAQASSTNADNAQTPVQKPQAETATNEAPASSNTTTAPIAQQPQTINLGMLNAAFNEFMLTRQDPRSKGVSDDHIAHVIATRFSSDPSVVAYIHGCITDNFARINFQNLQAAVQTSEPNAFEVFNEPEETNETTNPDEGKYPASSKKQQHNGKKGNNKKN